MMNKMRKKRFLSRILLNIIWVVFLILPGCSGGGGGGSDDDNAQTNLEGTWNVHVLEAGDANGWSRYNVTIDDSGAITFNSCLDSSDSTTCPAEAIVWTINQTTRVITETSNGTATDNHYVMSSDGTLIAGTGSGSSQVFIAQKRVSGTTYSNADLQGKNFVIHSLMVGGENKWLHETGSTDVNRAITINSSTDPSGTDNTVNNTGVILSVDANGIISMSDADMSTYRGFMSSDKKTIVGTFTEEGDTYQLMVVQITDGQTGNATSDVAGTWYDHMLGVGTSPAAFWAHQTVAINSAGVMTYSNWVCDSALMSGPDDATTIAIGSTGTATILGTDFHGQLSYNGQFLVGTQTAASDNNISYLLNVSILAAASSSTTSDTYSISGEIEGDFIVGVTIYLNGTASAYTTSDANGQYSFTGLANGAYTVTPFLKDYTFDPRSFSVTVDNRDVTLDGSTANRDLTCSALLISPTSNTFPPGIGSGTVTVTADSGCNWSPAISNASWLTVSSATSSTGGTVNYSLAANTSNSPRTGQIFIGSQVFNVTQAAQSCLFSINPSSHLGVSSEGDSGSVDVTASSSATGGAAANCPWIAVSNNDWIVINGANSGSGNGTINYTVLPNTDSNQRLGSITIAGQEFSVRQEGIYGVTGTWNMIINVPSMSCDNSGFTEYETMTLHEDSAGVLTGDNGTYPLTAGSQRTGSTLVINYTSSIGGPQSQTWTWDGDNTITGQINWFCYWLDTGAVYETASAPFTATRVE